MANPSLAERPPHVPSALCIDFDFLNPPRMQEDVQRGWYEVKADNPRLFWTPRNGGHWVATHGADIKLIQMDYARFSSAIPLLPYEHRKKIPALPLDLDPPEHGKYRLAIAASFAPRVIANVEDQVRSMAVQTIERFLTRGECDFVNEFAQVLPIVAFLSMMDLPLDDIGIFRGYAERVTRGTTAEKTSAVSEIAQYLSVCVEARRKRPGQDPISRIIEAKIDGQPMPNDKVIAMSSMVLGAGLDTVGSLLGFIARYLATHEKDRRRLLEEPDTRQKAINELVRRFGLVNHARQVRQDLEFHGVTLRRGDVVQLPNVLVGLDDELNPDPLTVDFDRPRPEHAAFGSGAHTCPGAVLAQREVKIFLDEWLARIPDFSIKPGTTPRVVSGTVTTHTDLWLSWPTHS